MLWCCPSSINLTITIDRSILGGGDLLGRATAESQRGASLQFTQGSLLVPIIIMIIVFIDIIIIPEVKVIIE